MFGHIGGVNMNKKQMIKNRARKRRVKEAAKKKLIFLLVTVFAITVGSIIWGSTFSAAQANAEEESQIKYYKSIMIQGGETLWSIAEEYKCEDESIQEYIENLKELNGIKSDTIHQGQHLVIAYYDSELK